MAESATVALPQRNESISSLHRDELGESVRHYADNLHRQLQVGFQKHGVSSFGEFREKVALGTIPLSELTRLSTLATTLEKTTKTGEIPFDERTFLDSVGKLVVWWKSPENEENVMILLNKYYGSDADLLEPIDLSYLQKKIDALPQLPAELFVTDKHLSQRILEKINSTDDAQQMFLDTGLLYSFIFNTAVRKLSEDLQLQVEQVVDTRNMGNISFLGYEMSRGTILVDYGDIGDYAGAHMRGGELVFYGSDGSTGFAMTGGKLRGSTAEIRVGEEMSGGTIMLDEVGSNAGRRMKGGELHVNKAHNYLGVEMSGGTIRVKEARNEMGKGMTGGDIFCEKAKHQVGSQMLGGTIYVDLAEDQLGCDMAGGKIVAKIVDDMAGHRMKKGDIYIDEARETAGSAMQGGFLQIKKANRHLGEGMMGGKIVCEEAGEDVGVAMRDGTIEVGTCTYNVGRDSTGGDIYIKDSYETVADFRGATVYFQGEVVEESW